MSFKKSRIFYGWFIVAALLLIWAFVSGITATSFTALIEPTTSRFGWNYTQVSFAASLRALMIVIFMPVAGMLGDRWGARKLVFAGIIVVGLGLILLSRINSLGQFYLCFILIGIGYCTCTGAIPQAVVGRWFKEKVSLATGILMISGGAGGLLVPVVTRIIDTLGWQTAMIILGLILLVLITPLSLLIRQNPEQYDHLSNAQIKEKAFTGEIQNPAQGSSVDTGIKQSLKNSAFWHITLAYMLHILAGSALTVHSMPYLATIGIGRATSSFVAGALSIVGVFGRLGFGWYGDRYNKKWMAASGTILVGTGLLLFSYPATITQWALLPAVILFGVGYGGTIALHSVLLREHFGTINLASVIGFSVGITAIGMVAGPPLASWIFESIGDYRIVWFILVGVVIISAVSQLTNPPVNIRKRRAG